MQCFGNGRPHLTNTEYAYNKKSKVRYNHIAHLAHENKCQTSNGKVSIDCSGYLVRADSYASLLSLTYGESLCAPCDLSSVYILTPPPLVKCLCEIPVSRHFIDALIEELGALFPAFAPFVNDAFLAEMGIGPHTMKVPWNFLRSPDSWNANHCVYDGSGDNIIELCDPSGTGSLWPYDGSHNVLDNPSTLDGSGVCIINNNNIFGSSCLTRYYPVGSFAFKFRELINMWIYAQDGSNPNAVMGIFPVQELIDKMKGAGYGAQRPDVSWSNYLSNVNGSGFGSLRFFLTSNG